MNFRLTSLLLISIFMTTVAIGQTERNSLSLDNGLTPESSQSNVAELNYRVIGLNVSLMDAGVWVEGDSVALTYSGTNGSNLVTGEINFDENIYYEWDGLIYTPDTRDVRSYGENGLVEEHIYQDYITGDWQNDDRDLFTYNDEDLLANRTVQIYNGGAWEDDHRFVFIYDQGQMISETRQNWSGSSWENDYRVVYTYNGSGYLATELSQSWDGSSWEDNNRHVYTYDGNGNMIEDVYDYWGGSSWILTSRTVMQYDADNWLTTETDQEWNGSDWENDSRTIYTHETGVVYYSEIIDQNYVSSSWENGFRSVFTFTEFNRVESAVYSNWDGTIWQVLDKADYYYEEYDDGTIGVESIDDLSVKVFPNPAAEYVTFRNDNKSERMVVEIYNLNGQLVKTLQGSGEIRWNINRNLPAGVYSYVLSIGDKAKRGQIIRR
ncbi:T9SS type A sorting domain-containing protein [Halocola ammonii]